MPTFQSMCRIFKQQRRRTENQAWRASFAAYLEREEHRRIALPIRQPDPIVGEVLHDWLFNGLGYCFRVRLMSPPDVGCRRQRCDRYIVEVDGCRLPELMGLTAVHEYIRRKMTPRQATRKQRYEADRETERYEMA